jgi:hypothetical protein
MLYPSLGVVVVKICIGFPRSLLNECDQSKVKKAQQNRRVRFLDAPFTDLSLGGL